MTERKVCPKCGELLDDGQYVIYDQHYSCIFPERFIDRGKVPDET